MSYYEANVPQEARRNNAPVVQGEFAEVEPVSFVPTTTRQSPFPLPPEPAPEREPDHWEWSKELSCSVPVFAEVTEPAVLKIVEAPSKIEVVEHDHEDETEAQTK